MHKKNINLTNKTLFAILVVGFILFFRTPEIKAAAGDLDPSFGSGGTVEYSALSKLFMNRIALQTDGKILIAGSRNTSQTQRLYLRRYNADGSLDTSFGLAGEAIEQVTPSNYSYIYAKALSKIAIQPDGSILVGGQRLSGTGGFLGLAVWRFKPDGLLDKSFDGDGRKDLTSLSGQFLDSTDLVEKVLLTKTTVFGIAQTKILVLCTYNNHHTYGIEENLADSSGLFRLNLDGSFDAAFGNNGKTEIGGEFNDAATFKPALSLTDEYIYLAGIGSDQTSTVVRLTNGGWFDTTFGASGVVSTGWPNVAAFKSMAVQKDGKFYLSGYANPAAGILIHYVYLMNENGGFQQQFGNHNQPNGIGLIYTSENDSGIGVQSDGKILVGSGFGLHRFLPNGSFDSTYASINNGLWCFAIQKDKKAVTLTNNWSTELGGYAGYTLRRYLAD